MTSTAKAKKAEKVPDEKKKEQAAALQRWTKMSDAEKSSLDPDLRKQLESLWPLHELTESQQGQVIEAVTSIVGQIHSPKAYEPRSFADVLIEDGLLLPNQLRDAVDIQRTEGGRLLKILTERQFVTEQDMAFSMGRCLNTPPINLTKVRVPDEIMSLVPRDMAKANKLVPIARLDGKLFVAMADPTNVLAVDDLKRRVQLEIVPMIATAEALRRRRHRVSAEAGPENLPVASPSRR